MVRLEDRRELLDAAGIARVLRRIASAILERNGGPDGLVLMGIRTGGVPLSQRLARLIAEAEGPAPALGKIDITLYRDDVFSGLPRPKVGPTELPGPIAGRKIVLVDDVLYTGRTVRAALDALMDFGRPRAVELAVLVDRGGRELPIQPDYTGLQVQTGRDETVKVELVETHGQDRVVLRRRLEDASAPPAGGREDR
ncbi:MAG: bifunctional pyr operon transcriptional regulator/uracil phosphoribosyltransferase PyrR [Myxococcales bacterium]|nr:bifunctional pyr operon transcriptional regulator/uracil phosphoribosyltransferase PyrR [Myxococcota bacterium]MDW8280479.1 bifunctional pyr operon transcriptional regulator/uracil phosphoribosyltransferase PyrR [Myxococcales bacterium]